ncbi:hypothetical protein C0993_003927 [Termitomyces sp. T159_Od127]|nr:hypothetical protein C0993_003927 [Termitomyces sp. T159_Od127]
MLALSLWHRGIEMGLGDTEGRALLKGFTLSDDAVDAVKTELNVLEKERGRVKQKALTVISADVVASQLKHSNQRPTSDQASVLETLLAQKNSEVAVIESDLLRLQLKINDDINALKELERLKAEKQAKANSYESWLVSVRLLPMEVITRILQYSISYRGPSTKRKTSPFLLSRVCSAWRNSALGCSSFWSDLELELSNFSADHRPHLGLLLDLWYGRANLQRPLSISLTGAKYADEDLTIKLASHIIKFSPRMTTVFVDLCGGPESLAAFLASPGGPFPNLTSLTFIESDFTAEQNTYPITVFDQSPRLQKVALRIPPGMFEGDCRLFLPWNQLTHLYVGGPLLMQSFAIILFQCTQLEVASFPGINLADQSDNREPILPPFLVEFPHLTDLRLRLNGPFFSQDISEVFEMMLLPNLKSLDLAGFPFSFYSGDGELFPVNSLLPPLDMLQNMRHLLLAYADITREELLETLVACPLLESLTVCLNVIDPITLLKDLLVNEPSGQPESVPRLSHMTLFTFACIIPKENDGNVFDHVAFTAAFTALVTLLSR